MASAERRALRLREDIAVPRVSDIYAARPAITGKMELEYEGELHGPDRIAQELIARAAGQVFETYAGGADVEPVVEYFEEGGALQVSNDSGAKACVAGFETVPGLLELLSQVGLAPEDCSDGHRASACELVLEALVDTRRISRTDGGGYSRAGHDAPAPGKGFPGSGPFQE